MTRSTASRVVAVLILGAAISSSVLAAPTRSPMIASSIGARGLQSQSSSSDGLGTLSEGQTRELASLKDDVPRQSGDGLTIDDSSAHGRMIPSSIGARDLQPQSSSDGLGTLSEGQTEELARVPTPQRGGKNGDGPTIDDLEHGRSDPSGNVLLSVKLKQQVNIAERGNQMSRQERQRQARERQRQARERQRQARERQRQTEAERQERAERENRIRAEKETNQRYLDDFTVKWFAAVFSNDRRKCLEVLTDRASDSEVPNHVRIKDLRDTLETVKTDPEFNGLWKSARNKWATIAHWVDQELRRVASIMHYDRDEVQWMAEFSKLAFEMKRCDRETYEAYSGYND